MPRTVGVLLFVCGTAIAAVTHSAAQQTYAIDQERSHATIAVGKSGLFSFAAGHSHEVVAPSMAGRITVNLADPERSTVQMSIEASAMKVTARGEPADDVPKVQETMLSDRVLDVQRFPTIDFVSTSVAVKKAGAAALDVIVNGRLTLREATRQVSVPVSVRIGPNDLTATGRFSLKQTDYGMTPVSVGGVVSVKDSVDISFTIVGR